MLAQRIFEHAVTVAKNDDKLLPFQRLDTLRIAAITIGTQAEGPYATIFNKYQPGPVYAVPDRYAPDSTFARIASRLRGYNVVVVSLHSMNNTPSHNYGLGDGALKFIKQLQANPKPENGGGGHGQRLRPEVSGRCPHAGVRLRRPLRGAAGGAAGAVWGAAGAGQAAGHGVAHAAEWAPALPRPTCTACATPRPKARA